jgi:membrane fusion protein, multidrug efflux system
MAEKAKPPSAKIDFSMNENLPQPPPAKNGNGARLARLNSPWFLWPATAGLVVLLYFALFILNAAFTQESTDDAFIAAHVVNLAPRVAGQVLAVHILDNQLVHSNDLLVEIDPATYALAAAQKKTSADAQLANYKAYIAGYELMRTKVATAEATADQSKADADAARATESRAQADYQRNQELWKQKTISAQEFDAAQAAATQSAANWKAAQENVQVQASKVDEARATVTATEAAIATALAQWQEAQTNIATVELNLSYTKIYAPCDGRVTRKSVEPGNYVDVGQQLMSIVPTEVWVVANFKESQLKHMKAGQHASVSIDALDRSFAAHVDSIQAGSGAAFSLLPPENATGNYVKVVQRVPVKIVFDEPLPADHTIGPGLSVVPDVQVGFFTLPDWALALTAIILAGTAAMGFRSALRRKLNGK